MRIGAPLGSVMGFDIDTGHFNGNESPASGVWGADVPDGQTIEENSAEVRVASLFSVASRKLIKISSSRSVEAASAHHAARTSPAPPVQAAVIL